MKKGLFIVCLIGFMSFFANSSQAQISVNFNVGSQPLWGPAGYDRANYYYLPDVDTYYSVANRQYIYQNNGKWIFSNSLPPRYSGYNLYNGYKVVMNTPKPYLSYETDRVKYAKYKGYKNKQTAIRYSNDPRYHVVKNHPQHPEHPHGMPPGQAKKYSRRTRINLPIFGRNEENRRSDRNEDNRSNRSRGSENENHGGGNGESHGGGNGESHGGGKGKH